MDVSVSALRANLSEWLDRARQGEEIVVTQRGVPIARLLGVDATATLERLVAEGVVGRPERVERPHARRRRRSRSSRPVSPLVGEQRR